MRLSSTIESAALSISHLPKHGNYHDLGMVRVEREIQSFGVDRESSAEFVITKDGPTLHLSSEQAKLWSEATGKGREAVGIDTRELYVASGLATIGLVDIAKKAKKDADYLPFIIGAIKMIEEDKKTKNTIVNLSETTNVNFCNLFEKLSSDEHLSVARLRYGIGTALFALEMSANEVRSFGEANFESLNMAVSLYSVSASKYIDRFVDVVEIGDNLRTGAEITESIYGMQFPYLNVAASAPMNVSYIMGV